MRPAREESPPDLGGTASVDGIRPVRGHAHHAAATAATSMPVRAAALEYGRGGVRLGRWERATPLGRWGERVDVGDVCGFLVSPMARRMPGHDLVVDGATSAVPVW